MRTYNKKGMTLVEALISICLISALVLAILGAFIISRLGVDRAKHRMMAMNTIRQYMEQEIKNGYWVESGEDTDYYLTVSDNKPIEFIIDATGTSVLTGTIRPDPFPAETYKEGTDPDSCHYKKIGFMVEWNEKLPGGPILPTSRERVAAYVADHS